MAKRLSLLIALSFLAGCESRVFTATRPDGTRVTYSRITILGESSTEGVEVSKDGDDFVVQVGSTGSKTDAEALLRGIELGLKLAAPIP